LWATLSISPENARFWNARASDSVHAAPAKSMGHRSLDERSDIRESARRITRAANSRYNALAAPHENFSKAALVLIGRGKEPRHG
jgi:hypothetical protein